MKIAVATENGESISSDFDRSPYFVVLEVNVGEILDRSVRHNPLAAFFRGPNGHRPGRAEDDNALPDACQVVEDTLGDCSVIISHRLGRRSCDGLRARGVKLIATEETQVEEAVRKYLRRIHGNGGLMPGPPRKDDTPGA